MSSKEELEQRFNIELDEVRSRPGYYKLKTNGVQKVFTGLPMNFTLEQVEELIPKLDAQIPDWRGDEDSHS